MRRSSTTIPLLVRSHDFSGATMMGAERLWQPRRTGRMPAHRRRRGVLDGFVGGPALRFSAMEEDFIAPENIQALIWKESVPNFWPVQSCPAGGTSVQTNSMPSRSINGSGEELLTPRQRDPELSGKVMDILSDRMAPRRSERCSRPCSTEHPADMLPRIYAGGHLLPGHEFRRKFPGEAASFGPANRELENLCQQDPEEVRWERLSRDFGVPHPVLAQSYSPELVDVKPFPSFGGHSSRLFAESWDSTNLYWARLADEMGYSPVMLNSLVPELTSRMVAKIFATTSRTGGHCSKPCRKQVRSSGRARLPCSPVRQPVPVTN